MRWSDACLSSLLNDIRSINAMPKQPFSHANGISSIIDFCSYRISTIKICFSQLSDPIRFKNTQGVRYCIQKINKFSDSLDSTIVTSSKALSAAQTRWYAHFDSVIRGPAYVKILTVVQALKLPHDIAPHICECFAHWQWHLADHIFWPSATSHTWTVTLFR